MSFLQFGNAQNIIINVPCRNGFTLNRKRDYIIDPYENDYHAIETFFEICQTLENWLLDKKPIE